MRTVKIKAGLLLILLSFSFSITSQLHSNHVIFRRTVDIRGIQEDLTAIGLNHGIKVEKFVSSLNIDPQAKSYVVKILQNSPESWSIKDVRRLVGFYYDTRFGDVAYQIFEEAARVPGAKGALPHLLGSSPLGTLRELIHVVHINRSGQYTVVQIGLDVFDKDSGQQITDIDIVGDSFLAEVKTYTDLVTASSWLSSPLFGEKTVADSLDEKVLNIIRAFQVSGLLENLQERGLESDIKLVIRISFDTISSADKNAVIENVKSAVGEIIERRLAELGIDVDYEVDVIELSSFLSQAYGFTGEYFNPEGGLNSSILDGKHMENVLNEAEHQVYIFRNGLMHEMIRVLNLPSQSPIDRRTAELLLDYLDSRGIRYRTVDNISSWITNESGVTLSRLHEMLIVVRDSKRPDKLYLLHELITAGSTP